MAIYLVTGKLRSGKTLATVARIRDAYLAEGKRVATNLDIFMEEMLPLKCPLTGVGQGKRNKYDVVRIPDKPTVDDLDLIGPGHWGKYDEDRFGALVLDELGSWLNTRNFQDKGRAEVINWLLHSGKKMWDVYFIIQHQNMVDKQVREGLAEFLVTCKRLDRMRIPVISRGVKLLTGANVTLPKAHVATVRYGQDSSAIVSDTWWYRGRDLYKAYDTTQVFTDERGTEHFIPKCLEEDRGEWHEHPARSEGRASGPFSYLSPWHTKGRYLEPDLPSPWVQFAKTMVGLPDLTKPEVVHKPKRDLVRLLQGLPPDQRLKHWRRLEGLGAFSPSNVVPQSAQPLFPQSPILLASP